MLAIALAGFDKLMYNQGEKVLQEMALRPVTSESNASRMPIDKSNGSIEIEEISLASNDREGVRRTREFSIFGNNFVCKSYTRQ